MRGWDGDSASMTTQTGMSEASLIPMDDLDTAGRLLARVSDAFSAKQVIALARAAEVIAARRGATEARSRAHAILVDATALLGEYLKGMPKAPAGRPDITSIPTRESLLDLAAVEDLDSQMVVGWSMADHLESRLVVDALQMAVARRLPGGVAGPLRPGPPGRQRPRPIPSLVSMASSAA
jgi:transposase InsO family protein